MFFDQFGMVPKKFFEPISHDLVPAVHNHGKNFGAMDIKEDDKGLSFTCDIPGAKKENVNVKVKEGVLSITGERCMKEEHDEPAGKDKKGPFYHVKERHQSKFFRQFSLPPECDEKSVKAKFEDGVLRVSVTKTAPPEPKETHVAIE